MLPVTQVDKLEQMLGSYGPNSTGEPYTKNFEAEESPTGMMARSGTYNVRSRVVDDDGEVYAGKSALVNLIRPRAPNIRMSDWEWSFKLAKEW
jgi:Rho GDP-dissociation inhibitor